ncbi:MAG: hypothetical protein ACFCUR_19595 [Rhodomicrobiaceae bacterium]
MSNVILQNAWTIRVHQDGDLIEDYSVPGHRLSDDDVKKLLVSVVGLYERLPFADFVDLHLNRRKGGPTGLGLQGPEKFTNFEKGFAGYRCIGPSIDAFACFPLSKEYIRRLRAD